MEQELESIRARRQHHPRWAAAQRWCANLNIETKSADQDRWTADFPPRFRGIRLEAEALWASDLEDWLIDFPGVEREYFGDRGRCFCSLEEARLVIQDVPAHAVDFVGRESQLSEFDAFLLSTSQTFLQVDGSPGVGKTRFLYEGALRYAGPEIDVHWGLSEHLERSEDWFGAIVPERRALLLLDDVTRSLIAHLVEQMRARNIVNWKVVATARPGEAPLFPANMRLRGPVSEVALPPLSEEQSKVLYKKIIATLGRRPALPEGLVMDCVFRFSGGSPFWLIELLEGWREDDIDVAGLRREFAREKALARIDAAAPSVGTSANPSIRLARMARPLPACESTG